MLTVIMPSITMLSVIMVSGIMMRVMAPFAACQKTFLKRFQQFKNMFLAQTKLTKAMLTAEGKKMG
jgi:hypothetical protein